jgi:hypothetical protein
MVDYFYSITTDFQFGFNPQTDSGELSLQIANDQSITTFLLSINPDPNNSDLIIITFASALSPSEETALDDLIANFVPPLQGNYVIIESTLADDDALQLLASDANGGILIQSGFGGIEIITTNSFTVTAAAASGILTSLGNVTLEATAALVNLDGGAGTNIQAGSLAGPVNIGTGSEAHVVSIGNNVATSAVNIAAAAASNFSVSTTADAQDLTVAVTGATDSSIILSSQGTGADAISMISNGGILLYSDSVNNHPINIISNTNIANAVNIDTNSNGGGIIISSGIQGLFINSNGGALGVANFSGGDVYFATAGAARNVFFGTNSAATVLYKRFGKGQLDNQASPIDIALANSPLTMAELSTRLLYGTPSGTVALIIPDPVAFVTYFPSVVIGDSLDFTIINQSATPGDVYNLDIGTQTSVGSISVLPGTSGSFRIRMTNITFPTQAYVVYRIA